MFSMSASPHADSHVYRAERECVPRAPSVSVSGTVHLVGRVARSSQRREKLEMATYSRMDDVLREIGAWDEGWISGTYGDTLVCPCGNEIELDGKCPEGCVSPLRSGGMI